MTELMDNASLFKKIKDRFSEAQETIPPDPKWVSPEELQVKVPSARVGDVAAYLKNDLGFDFLSFVTAVDRIRENRFEVVYYFMKSAEPKTKFFLKADLPREGEPSLPSVSPLYSAADWQEREVFDLFGIRFEDHPNLKRILLWEGYPGYPLRKDYVHVQDKYDNGQEIGIPKLEPAAGHEKPSPSTGSASKAESPKPVPGGEKTQTALSSDQKPSVPAEKSESMGKPGKTDKAEQNQKSDRSEKRDSS